MAVAFASAPIAGQNFGASAMTRVRETFTVTALIGSSIMLTLSDAPLINLRGAYLHRRSGGARREQRLSADCIAGILNRSVSVMAAEALSGAGHGRYAAIAHRHTCDVDAQPFCCQCRGPRGSRGSRCTMYGGSPVAPVVAQCARSLTWLLFRALRPASSTGGRPIAAAAGRAKPIETPRIKPTAARRCARGKCSRNHGHRQAGHSGSVPLSQTKP